MGGIRVGRSTHVKKIIVLPSPGHPPPTPLPVEGDQNYATEARVAESGTHVKTMWVSALWGGKLPAASIDRVLIFQTFGCQQIGTCIAPALM